MKLIKHGIVALFLTMAGLSVHAQDNGQKKEVIVTEDSLVSNYQMKNHGVITYSRRRPVCSFIKRAYEDSEKIVCTYETNSGNLRKGKKREKGNGIAKGETKGSKN